MSTLPELAAVAALVQVLVEHFSRELDEGRSLSTVPPWFVRETKWRAARYGLEADVIVDRDGTQRAVVDHLRETIEALQPIAEELHCARELAGIETIVTQGASHARQLLVADAAEGDLREVVHHLIREFRAGPTLRDHLAALGH
jgi:carboxylate-amine ligase